MKKILSIVLALVMLFTLVVPCFAEGEEETAEQVNYLLLGDSIAAGLGLKAPERISYGALVAYSNGYSYQNDAISGHTSAQLLNRISTNSTVREHIKEADIISVSIGGNDFLMTDFFGLIKDALISNDYSRFEQAADGCYENLKKIYAEMGDLNGDAVILLQNLYNPRTDFLREVYANGIKILNSRIEKFAAETDRVYLIDVAAYTEGFGSEYFQRDQTHPNAACHAVIAQAVLDKLFELELGTAETVIAPDDIAEEPSQLKLLLKSLFEKLKSLLNELIRMIKASREDA